MSQRIALISHLQKNEISQLVAFNKLGICRLSQRIIEIEWQGFRIDRRTAKMVNQHGNTCRYTVYSMPKTAKNQKLFKDIYGSKCK